jgi:two-component system response regulator YesN
MLYTAYVLDDDALVLEDTITTIQWRANGFEMVGSNKDPILAVDEIISKKPDVVLCDRKMPKLNGFQVFEKLKEAGLRCEFVMLTAIADDDAAKDLRSMGGFEYLLKPFSKENDIFERLFNKLTKDAGLAPVDALVTTGVQAFDDVTAYISAHCGERHTLQSVSGRCGL